MTDGHNPTSASDIATKLLAALDSISGFTFLAVAVAGALVLTLPSPLLRIDLSPARVGRTGTLIAGATILAVCLVAAKLFRSAYQARASRFEHGRGRPVTVIWQNRSFWQGNQSPNGPVIQIHLQGLLTNPNAQRGLIVARFAVFRLTPFGIFFAQECANFSIGDSGPLDLQGIPPRYSAQFRLDHFFRDGIRVSSGLFGSDFRL